MKELELKDCDIWISGVEACRVLGISTSTLKRYRTQGKLPEGCFKKLNSRMVRYNLAGWLTDKSLWRSDEVP